MLATQPACQPEGNAPAQERMAPERRVWRQGLFRRHVAASVPQPSLSELLSSPSSSNLAASASAPVTVILNHFKRHTLCRQIEALLSQSSGPPAHIWVCLFASPMAASARAAALSYNDSRIAVIESEHNFKYFGRFQLALSAPTRYVLVFDDDMVPGRRYLATLIHAAGSTHARGALLGSIGWLLPRPRPAPDLRLGSYRSLRNDSGGAYLGLYVPDLAYDLLVDRMLEVDYLCSLWFGEARLLRLLFREAPYTFATGEDFHLSHMLRKHAAAPSYVLPVHPQDRTTWGDTDHALAYNRFSTGGAATIDLRDRIWWNGVRGGGTVHWARRPSEPSPLGPNGVLVVVDGRAHARALRPLVSRLASSSRHVVAVALTGGLRGTCAVVAPELGLAASACEERRIRVFDMQLGRDQPARPSAPPVVASMPASRAASRLDAEALADLGQVVRAARPRLLIGLDDPSSAGTRAAARLSRFGATPFLRVPLRTPAWALESLCTLSVAQLARWGATPLSLIVLASSDAAALRALHASISSAALLVAAADHGHANMAAPPSNVAAQHGSQSAGDRTVLTILTRNDAPREVASYARREWAWPRHAKHVRSRVEPIGGYTCGSATQLEAIRALEAWLPRSVASAGASKAQATRSAGGEPGWALLLSDDCELSAGFHVYVRHFLASLPSRSTDKMLGLSLGPPAGSGDKHPRQGRLAEPSTCGTVYSSAGWRELHAFAATKLASLTLTGDEAESPVGKARCEARRLEAPSSWSDLQQQFMRAHGFALHYPGLHLCRRRGDLSVTLASGEDVAKIISAEAGTKRG